MNWFEQLWTNASRFCANFSDRKDIPEGLWRHCDQCGAIIYHAELERNLSVCPKCGYHMRISARQRISYFLDNNGQQEIAAQLKPIDRLNFKDLKRYRDRIEEAQKRTGERDALVVMVGSVHGIPLVCSCFDFGFIGGSMGSVVGEKFVQGVDYCVSHNLPLVNFSASGGARMQEGLFSLMQMAKTSAALAKMANYHLPYISVLTDPTTGGVSASLAMLGDVIIAEPGATIGFAGRRVIEQTIRQQLPDDFQSSEFLLEHGAIDRIVSRVHMRREIASILSLLLRRSAPRVDD